MNHMEVQCPVSCSHHCWECSWCSTPSRLGKVFLECGLDIDINLSILCGKALCDLLCPPINATRRYTQLNVCPRDRCPSWGNALPPKNHTDGLVGWGIKPSLGSALPLHHHVWTALRSGKIKCPMYARCWSVKRWRPQLSIKTRSWIKGLAFIVMRSGNGTWFKEPRVDTPWLRYTLTYFSLRHLLIPIHPLLHGTQLHLLVPFPKVLFTLICASPNKQDKFW